MLHNNNSSNNNNNNCRNVKDDPDVTEKASPVGDEGKRARSVEANGQKLIASTIVASVVSAGMFERIVAPAVA